MQSHSRTRLAVLVCTAAIAACSDTTTVAPIARFAETRLVADSAGLGAAAVDTNLKNPWGIAFGPTSVLWVSDNHSGRSSLYRPDGTRIPTAVTIPSSSDTAGGAPSGVVYDATSSFVIPGAGSALFIFAGEDGVLSAWNNTTPSARRVASRAASGAVYKGLALAASGGKNFLFATNFRHDAVDVFDSSFTYVRSFTDSTVPAGFAPFGIATIGGELYVTFAKRLPPDSMDDQSGPGNGYVDVFHPDGTLVRRFASTGMLDSPWAVVAAPAAAGKVGGAILIGNFGDGTINAYDVASGAFLTQLRDSSGAALAIDGLWGLAFGPTASDTTLYFTAGPDGEAHGLLGTLTPR